VRDERPDLACVLGHERERVHGSIAAGEDVDGLRAECADQPVQGVGVLVGRGLGGAVRAHAAFGRAGS
jgi:hypothetical protein